MPILGSGLILHRANAAWWLSGGISAANCSAAYASKGAASLAASYINLNNPGTNNAAPGTAPTWDATNGWIFNGSSQYLTTGSIPAAGWSIVARFSNLTNSGYLAGSSILSNSVNFLLIPRSGGDVWGYGGGILSWASGTTTGVIAMAADKGYTGGTQRVTGIGTWSGTGIAIFIGSRNYNGSFDASTAAAVKIQALSIYNSTLTAGQVSAVTTAMNLL